MAINKELFAANLRSRRAFLGLTLRDVRDAIGISPATLSKIEHQGSNCSVETLVSLADLYESSVDELLGRIL